MNSIKIFKTTLITILMLFVASACNTKQGQTETFSEEKEEIKSDQLKAEKEEMLTKIEEAISDADLKLEAVQTKLEEAKDEVKPKLESVATEIETQREHLDEKLNDVNNASQETWQDVKQDIEYTLDNVKTNLDLAVEEMEDVLVPEEKG